MRIALMLLPMFSQLRAILLLEELSPCWDVVEIVMLQSDH
jgi:hypothetical protein